MIRCATAGPVGMGGALCIDPEAGTDQAISDSTATANDSVRPGPGYKLQATSFKLQAPSTHPDLLPEHGPEYYAPRRRRKR